MSKLNISNCVNVTNVFLINLNNIMGNNQVPENNFVNIRNNYK